MPTLSQTVRNLCGGVTQQPQSQRAPSQFSEQINGLTYQGRLLGKRPPSTYVANISDETETDPFIHIVPRSVVEKYAAVVNNGTLEVFNQFTGAAITLVAPDGFDYLTDDSAGYRAVSIGDQTVLVNRAVVVRKGTAQSADATNKAHVLVRQGNFGTGYTIFLASDVVSHTTPQSGAANAEALISTDVIAEELFDLLEAETAYDGVFTFALTGSLITITPVTPSALVDFYTVDGLGNEGLQAIRGSVQRFSDLPEQAPDGTIIEIRGDEDSAFDNFWVLYDESKSAWVETVAPGCLTGFDATTLPHLLEYRGKYVDSAVHDDNTHATVFEDASLALTVDELAGLQCRNRTDGSVGLIVSNTTNTITVASLVGGGSNEFRRGDVIDVVGYGTYFMFRPAPWGSRETGDLTTNAYPSLIDRAVRDVFVTDGRLGLISGKSFVLSRAREPYKLFRKSVTQVLADDPIDITEALPGSSLFHAFTEWNGKRIIWTDKDQFELGTGAVLSPQTVSLRKVASYPNLSTCRPIVAGDRVFFVGLSNSLPRIMELLAIGENEQTRAQSLTDDLPTYFDGWPVQLEADDTLGLLLVRTEAFSLYVYSYTMIDGSRVQQAWGKWVFGGSE